MTVLLTTVGHVAAKPDTIPDCTLWLDADDLTGADGDTIATWANKGSLGGNATSATTARPTLVTDVGGSTRQGLRFDGVDDHITTASGAFVSASGWTAVAVFANHNRSGPGDGSILDADNGIGSGRVAQFFRCSDALVGSIAFNTGGTAYTASAPALGAVGLSAVFSTYTPTGVTLHVEGVDGVELAATGTPRSTSTAVRVGGRVNGGQWMHGVVCEVAIWSRPLTAAEILRVRTYLDTKYGIEAIRRQEAPITPTTVAFAANIRANVPTTEQSVNGAAWIRDPLWTEGTTQYAVWTSPTLDVRVSSRTHGSATWATPVELTDLGAVADDSHFASSLGVDNDGYLHVVGDTRNSALQYVKSDNPNDITAWSVATMTPTTGMAVSYPQFIKAGTRFFFFHRDGGSTSSDWHLLEYDHTGGTWSQVGELISGSPYPMRLSVSPVDNSFHLAWAQRGAGLYSNYHIGYLRSADYGATWTTGSGAAFTIPAVVTSTTPLVASTPTNEQGQANQPGACVDYSGRFRFGTWMLDPAGYLELWHGMVVGGALRLNKVTHALEEPDLATDIWPSAFRRPQMAAFSDGTVWMVYTSKSPSAMFVADVTDPGNIRIREVSGVGGFTEVPFDEMAVRSRDEFYTIMPASAVADASTSLVMVAP